MTRQTNFGGGELAPLLHGRSDLPVYARGARTMRNFFPSRHGAAVSRPGSLFVGTTKTPGDVSVRLIPFVFSDTQSFVLEFGAGYIRFYTNGGQLVDVAGNPYEKTTSYTGPHLRGLKYAQTGDILTITRAGYAPMELRRLPDWTALQLAAVKVSADAAAATQRVINLGNFLGHPIATNAEIAAFRQVFIAQGEATVEAIAVTHGVDAFDTYLAANPADYFGATDAYRDNYFNFYESILTGAPHWTFGQVGFSRVAPFFAGDAGGYPTLNVGYLFAATATQPDVVWQYAITLTVQDTETGRQYETLPWFVGDSWDLDPTHVPVVLADDLHAIYPDRPMMVFRGGHLNRTAANATPVDHSYRELGWNIYRGHNRRTMGLIGTATGDRFIDNGATPDYLTQPPLGTNPFIIYDYAGAYVSTESPFAVAFFEERRFFGGTFKRPAALFGSATGDYPNYDLHDLIHSAGESVLFELGARRLEEIVHLVTSEKLLVGTRSTWWAFGGAGGPLDFDSVEAKVVDEVGTTEATPLTIDGSVLYARAKGAGVRALRSDQGGNYRGYDISTHSDHLFIGNGDYFPTLGFTKKLVDWTFAEDPWGVAWAVREDGMLLSLTYKSGDAGWAWHDSYTANGAPGLYTSVCSVPEGDEDAVYVVVRRFLASAANGHAPSIFLPAGGTGWALCVERMTSRVRNGDAEDDACVDCGLRFEGVPTTTIGGLGHLAGEQVWFVAVGNPPMGPLLVSAAGEITLPDLPLVNDGANVVGFIGLFFQPDLETLNSGGSRVVVKGVTRIGLDLEQSSGIKVGRDFDHLVETRPHTAATGYVQPSPTTELVLASVPNKFDDGARVCVRQTKPLPTTIVAIERDIDVGGK